MYAIRSYYAFNIGGGLPIRNNLGFEYDYTYIINEIVRNISDTCSAEDIEDPDIYTEFGRYTVGESGAVIFKTLEVVITSYSIHYTKLYDL